MTIRFEARPGLVGRTAEQAYQEDLLEAAYREQPRNDMHPRMAEVMRRTFQAEASAPAFPVARTVFEA